MKTVAILAFVLGLIVKTNQECTVPRTGTLKEQSEVCVQKDCSFITNTCVHAQCQDNIYRAGLVTNSNMQVTSALDFDVTKDEFNLSLKYTDAALPGVCNYGFRNEALQLAHGGDYSKVYAPQAGDVVLTTKERAANVYEFTSIFKQKYLGNNCQYAAATGQGVTHSFTCYFVITLFTQQQGGTENFKQDQVQWIVTAQALYNKDVSATLDQVNIKLLNKEVNVSGGSIPVVSKLVLRKTYDLKVGDSFRVYHYLNNPTLAAKFYLTFSSASFVDTHFTSFKSVSQDMGGSKTELYHATQLVSTGTNAVTDPLDTTANLTNDNIKNFGSYPAVNTLYQFKAYVVADVLTLTVTSKLLERSSARRLLVEQRMLNTHPVQDYKPANGAITGLSVTDDSDSASKLAVSVIACVLAVLALF